MLHDTLCHLHAVDHSAGDLNVFETGAIMWYLAQKHPESGLWPKVQRSPHRCIQPDQHCIDSLQKYFMV